MTCLEVHEVHLNVGAHSLERLSEVIVGGPDAAEVVYAQDLAAVSIVDWRGRQFPTL